MHTLTAGSGNTTIKGSDKNDTIIAGTGVATLYGGGGRNVLANGTEEKEGSTAFFVLAANSGARNTISGFEFLATGDDEDNSATADVLEIGTKDSNFVSNVFIKGDEDVVIEVSNASGSYETAVIEGAVGQDMKVSQYVAQVNKTALNYDGAADFFVATEKNASITVGEDLTTAASIWLGNQSNSRYMGDIRTINAADATVKTELAGNDTDNTITAGSGDASLWGGNGGDDLLNGGTGKNMFFYANGNGNDTIQGVNEGDVVYLGGVVIDNIIPLEQGGWYVQNDTAVISFTDGGKLTVNNATNATFVIGGQEGQPSYHVEGDKFVAGDRS